MLRILKLFSSFNSFFTETDYNISTNITYLNLFKFNFLIFNCFFKNIFSENNSIFNFKISNKIVFENIIFCNCSGKISGGIISFIGSYLSGIIFYKTCFNECFGHYIWQEGPLIYCNILENQKNQIFLSTFSKNGLINNLGEHLFKLSGGNQTIKDINSSLNSITRNSFGQFHSPFTFFSIFCNVLKNNVSNHGCIHLISSSLILSFFNIILNNSPNGNGIINSYQSSILIKNCLFFNNYNTLLYNYQGSLTLIDCNIEHNSFLSSGVVVLNNINYTLIETIIIKNFKCNIIETNLKIKKIICNIYLFIFFF